jgi:hypothetical protein
MAHLFASQTVADEELGQPLQTSCSQAGPQTCLSLDIRKNTWINGRQLVNAITMINEPSKMNTIDDRPQFPETKACLEAGRPLLSISNIGSLKAKS